MSVPGEKSMSNELTCGNLNSELLGLFAFFLGFLDFWIFDF